VSRRGAAIAAGALGLLTLATLGAERRSPASERHTLHVFAAASLSDALADLARTFERTRPGLVVRCSFAGSQQLAAQIEQGAAADLFASADQRWIAYASERGLLAGEPVEFARNRLVAIVPASNPARIRRLQDLARSGVKLVLGADAVPVGRYARIAIRNLAHAPGFDSDFAVRALRNVVSEEENVKSVVGKVQLGEADAGVVYRSDVTPAIARFVHVLELPDSANVIASYPMALVRGGAEPEAAREFMDLVLSSEGQQALERHGLLGRVSDRP